MFNENKQKINNSYNKKQILFSFIIAILGMILGYEGVHLFYLTHQPKVTQAFKTQSIQQFINNKVKNEWTDKINQLQAKFQRDASINVLQGTVDINVTYSNKDTTGQGNRLNFLQKKFLELQSKDITVNTTYKFGYSFDLSNLIIQDLNNGKIKINLNQSNIDLKYIEEITANTMFETNYGLFSSKFTPQEIQAVMNTTQIHTKNSLMNNSELRAKASEYAKQTIEDMTNKFNFKNVSVEIIPDNLIDNNEVSLSNVVIQ